MVWPFRKVVENRASPDVARDLLYVSRPQLERAISEATGKGDNLVIYGPPNQGKTMLITRQLGAESIYIQCRPDFKRAEIYRVALAGLGYALLVEKKRRGKASATVKLTIASTGLEAGAEGETEELMQPVTVDLKNPTEVAHLISRIKDVPWIVLDNFQLLDSGTKSNLLFDLAFFAERPGIRMVIVGAWSQEDYLEEIEPALADKFRYVLVPTWSDAELREAAAKWSAGFGAITPPLDEFLALAAGDVSLFRALLKDSLEKAVSPSRRAESPSAELPVQAMIIGRFRRGLTTNLKAIFAQREAYVSYWSLQTSIEVAPNPDFHQIPDASESEYLRTLINPQTKRPFPGGIDVPLDQKGNAQYIEQETQAIVENTIDIVSFLLLAFHSAVKQGDNKIDLERLAREFAQQLSQPLLLDESKLRSVFARVDELQRKALVVPSLLAVDGKRDAMEIVDRRLFLFLQSVDRDDLEELLESAQPDTVPKARRRNRLFPVMTESEKAEYIARAMPASEEAPGSNGTAAPEAPEFPAPDASALDGETGNRTS